MLREKYERAQTSRPATKQVKEEKKVQDDLYVTVNMIDVLENYRKSVDFYNSYDEHKNKTQGVKKGQSSGESRKNPEIKK